MAEQTPLLLSFFSGSGFLDLGFEKSGYHIVYVNEIYKPFLEAYKFSRKTMNIPTSKYSSFEGDIENCLIAEESERLTQIIQEIRNERRLVGFIGGPPCPDFSVAGKNRGQYGKNGKLSQTYIDLICLKKPDFFVFENVKGLWRTARHRQFFEHIKYQLQEFGYVCTEHLINAIEYGVPQDRERIILFGIKKEIGGNYISNFNWFSHIVYPRTTAFQYPWPSIQPISLDRAYPGNVPNELTIQFWFEKNDVEHHPNALHQFKPRAGLVKFETIFEGDDSKKSYKRLHRWRYSPTAAYGNNEVHIHPYLPRRISVAEALAIQSLPKEFVLPSTMTLSDMFKTIGNGVPYLAARAVALTVLDFLRGIRK